MRSAGDTAAQKVGAARDNAPEKPGFWSKLMLERGAFHGLDAAMMVHPAATEMATMPGLAVSQFEVGYRGKSAHAGAWPQHGVNAADAMTIAQAPSASYDSRRTTATGFTASSPMQGPPPT